MKERPILFSAAMVRTILNGSKINAHTYFEMQKAGLL